MSNRLYPQVPRLAVGAICFQGKRVLLVQRNQEPKKGVWTFPGGVVDLGESVTDAVRREVEEECRIVVRPITLVDAYEHIEFESTQQVKYHYIILEYLVEYISGDLEAGDDVRDARWIDTHHLDTLSSTQDTRRLIENARRLLASIQSSVIQPRR